ncbi:MAG: glycosyltransferase family 39 protein [Acidobacteria bacterium]|nr:glycosyltransferase family 39 protein [Acidobacteriota bacterium]
MEPGLLQPSEPRRRLQWAALVVVLLAALYVYRGAFQGFFVQDDYGWLESTRFSSFREYAGIFFRFNPALSYRPLSQETFFFLAQKVFGMWPPGFHLVSVLVHLLAVLLVFLISRRFCPVAPSLAGTFFFALHSAQMRSVYWISAIAEPMALVFILTSILFFIRYDRGNDRRAYFFSLPAMGLGMMSKESTLTLPVVLALYSIFYSRRRILSTLPFFAVSGLYAVLRMTSKAVGAAPYPLTFGPEALGNLASYFTWAAGFTDTLLGVKLGREPASCYPVIAVAFALAVALLVWSARDRKPAGFALLWFAVALQPILYFWKHIDPYYLAPALAALALLIAASLPEPRGILDWKGILPAAALAGYVLWFAPPSIRLEGQWWNERAMVGKRILDQMPAVDRQVPDDRIAYIFGLTDLDLGILQNDAAFKAFGFSITKYILMGVDPETPRQIRTLQAGAGLWDYYCFLYARGTLFNMTEEFRRNPQNFLNPVGLRVTPAEIQSGMDTMTVEAVNFDAGFIDLMYTLDGKPMPPVTYWKLDPDHRARVFVDGSTPKGLYHFVALRDSDYPDDSRWYPIDVRVVVR